ncbi:RNA polymerase sigma factor [Moheibacter sediminis]|uniref:RNA polymerase sigma-70 factor, ECF subfamily n=1 Tax=Moheibacter sediminis TaxID=1434700 RepID=A0A1W1ZNP8_9FLAO|nr:sigma-70 family RNA polymerase sigma factor [Moheibacter sediminis]SMC49691.1 RNA polymerase sigma-70 factor, ECF subfamily [Moheibacter sediminis]
MAFQHTTEIIEDELLVEKIVKANDAHLFGLLYDRYVPVVYNKCLSFVSSKEEAQDLTHDIFVKLFVKLNTFKGESKFSTWIYAFTYNHCVNYIQRNQKAQKNTKSINEDIEDEFLDEISDEQIHEMKAEKLATALQKIGTEDKALLLMKYQDDFSIKEIANTYEIGESAAKMRLSRAKSNLINIYKTL